MYYTFIHVYEKIYVCNINNNKDYLTGIHVSSTKLKKNI